MIWLLLKADGRFAPLPIAASRTVALAGTMATVGLGFEEGLRKMLCTPPPPSSKSAKKSSKETAPETERLAFLFKIKQGIDAAIKTEMDSAAFLFRLFDSWSN